MRFAIVVPWVTNREIKAFLEAWEVTVVPDWLVLQCDANHEGCGVTKNRGIVEATIRGAETVIILDGDCYPSEEHSSLLSVAEAHIAALEPQPVEMFTTVTSPSSRGTPYQDTSITYPVAASMGFWNQIGDYCAVRQLAFNAAPMTYVKQKIYGRYFPLCGMNLAFRPAEWIPWCQFIDVPRFDDIWMGWLWQREAYRRGYCFNLSGPVITHARQSNVWKNLKEEAAYLLENETLWKHIALHEFGDYDELLKLLPIAAAQK